MKISPEAVILESIETLRNPETPKVGDVVRFRPSGKSLENIDYWRRHTWPGRWFSMNPEPQRYLVGKIQTIKRSEEGFYYRVTSGMMGLDVSFKDVLGKGEE
jgi:hypothetical protein